MTKFFLSLTIIFLIIGVTSAQTTVSNSSELNTAISNASAGDEIILANGIWNDVQLEINKNGTTANPITIKAETPNQVFIEGNSNIEIGGSYIIIEGFVFQNASNLVVSDDRIQSLITFRAEGNSCNNCKVTNIKIDSYNGSVAQNAAVFKWVLVYGSNNEISHSSFIGKNGVGSIINHNRSNNIVDYTKIHHNYFADRIPVDNNVNGLNDQDAIRLGTSSTSLSDSFSEVYDNFFYNWSGEVEIISNKSGNNKYYNNTFRDYQGTLTLRHGNGCEVFGNYFFGNNNSFSGGVRVIGEDHKVYNNYFEGLRYRKPSGAGSNTTGALNITNGKPDSALNEYYQPKNIQLVNNTLIDCDYGIRVGTVQNSENTLAPENVTIANNIIIDSSISAFSEVTTPTGNVIYEGNINQNGNWDLTNGVNNNQTVSSDLLESGSEFYRITNQSVAVDASIGNYSFLTNDILGGNRTGATDAGAEEFGANGTKLPYTVADVSEKVGFLSNVTDKLTTSVNKLNFNIDANSTDIEVNSNTNWSVSSNQNWLSVNTNSGSNSTTIQVNVTQNNSGNSRDGAITITTDSGALSTVITVVQTTENFDSNNAIALTNVTVTGVGTQEPNNPENTLDTDVTTRWSANATDGSAYLTYNLGCKKTVSSVKIYFHKGDQRTSSFKIATSVDGTIFSDATAVLSSSGKTTDFEEFVLSPFQNVQYVRVLGFGNSEGSGWNSYEEIQIFGNNSCETLSTEKNTFTEKGITIFPVPTKNGILNITSKSDIGNVTVFDIRGKELLSKNIQQEKGFISVENLAKGIYIIKIANVFSRFIIE